MILISLISKIIVRDMRFITADRSGLGQKRLSNSKTFDKSYGPTP